MKALFTISALCFFLFSCSSEKTEETPIENEPEVAAADSITWDDEAGLVLAIERIRKIGVPTPEIVENMRIRAINLYEEGNWALAIDSLKQFSHKANWLANLISKGLQPFYDASYSDRQSVSRSQIGRLAEYESLSNELKSQRNQAYVMIAECYLKIGEPDLATAYFFQSLELIPVSELEQWDRARNGLYQLIELV